MPVGIRVRHGLYERRGVVKRSPKDEDDDDGNGRIDVSAENALNMSAK